MGLSATLAEAVAAFHFLRPAWLLALPALWAAVAWLARQRGREGDWSGLIDADLLPGLRLAASDDGGGTAPPRSPWPWLAAVWTAAVIALAGPSWERDAAPAYRAPAAWVLVLDLSPSMAAADLSPDRATRARYAIADLLAAAHDARVGLVVFGDEAYTVAPLTDDVATVEALLPPLAPSLLPSPGDHAAPGLQRAQELLARGGAGVGVGTGHVLVLSDGIDDPAAAFRAAASLRAGGATVDVIGIGTAAGAPVPAAGGGFVTGGDGQPVLARLNADPLQQLAAAGGGRYLEPSQLPSLIASLTAAPLSGAGAEAAAADVAVVHWRDAGAWLLPALVVFVAGLARRGWL